MAIGGDFLVIGSGVAGLRAALSLAEHGEVLVLTKAEPTESNTGYAQGGIAAALGSDDSPQLHARDTIAAGKRAFYQQLDMGLERAYTLASGIITQSFLTEEGREGMAAFIEKRPPPAPK